jgi:membrane dipeptidase
LTLLKPIGKVFKQTTITKRPYMISLTPYVFKKSSLVLLIGLSVAGCQPPSEVSSANPEGAKASVYSAQQAIDIAHKYPIIDTHVDLPYRLEDKYEDVSVTTEGGDFDYPRALSGGLDAPFMSIYIPAELELTGGSKALADKLIDGIELMVKQHPEKFALAHSVAELENNFTNNLISLPMGMENGSPIEGDMANLVHFYARGIRYITLTHSKANHISDSSYDEQRPAGGLTEFGKQLVTEMNNTGVMVDVSHISDQAFFQVMDISQTAVIASHSSARKFTPGFERNMSDEMITLLAKHGGIIQINFGSSFIKQSSRDNHDAYKAALASFIQEHAVAEDSQQATDFTNQYRQARPFEYASLEDVLDHYEHVIKLVGIDHVGIGSDYDGVGDSLPTDLKDVASYPNLVLGLLERGYSEVDIAKILGGNILRVWKEVEQYAASQKQQ